METYVKAEIVGVVIDKQIYNLDQTIRQVHIGGMCWETKLNLEEDDFDKVPPKGSYVKLTADMRLQPKKAPKFSNLTAELLTDPQTASKSKGRGGEAA